MASTTIHSQSSMASKVHRNEWIWFLIAGICLTIIGLVALSMPVVVSFGTELLIGSMLLVGGLIQLYHAFKERKINGFWFSAITSVLIIAMGGFMLAYPLVGMVTMTALITTYLIVVGIVKTIYGFQLKPLTGWGWMVFSGIVSFVLGIMLFYRLPVSALYILGLFVGVDLLIYGISEIGLALNWRRLTHRSV